MLKNLFFSIFIFSALGLSSQNIDTTHKNYAVFYYENGQKSSEGYLFDGKPDQYWISYYPNAKIKSEGNRENFMLDSLWKFYDEKGRINSTIEYFQNYKHGFQREYDSLGQLIKEVPYVRDTIHGELKLFFGDSLNAVHETVPYIGGLRQGIGYLYAKEDGRIISIVEYEKDFVASREEINRKNEKGEKIGVWKKFYPNGRLRFEARYKNGLLNGYLKKYDDTGKLESAELYLNGVLQTEDENLADFTIEREYYPDGKIRKMVTFNLSGKRDGASKEFDEKGNLLSTDFYGNGYLIASGIIDDQGLKQGLWKEFYINGNTKSEGNYTDGLKTGKWKYFFMNGELEQEGFFDESGKFTNEWKWYYPNGKILRTENYRRGLEDGISMEYNEAGEIISSGEYLDGEKMGEWIYELNDHVEKGNYRYGLKNGRWIGTYPNGKLSFEGNYTEGLEEGKHRYYYPSGILKREENYRYGLKHGKWRWYDETGVESLNIQYKDDVEWKIDGTKVKYTKTVDP